LQKALALHGLAAVGLVRQVIRDSGDRRRADPKDLQVEITDQDEREVHVSEFQSLFRSVQLPEDPNNLKVDFKNGLLTLNAPVAEAQQPRKVEIQTV
jgi:hypothetical protein